MFKILLVDDEENIRRMIREYAEFLGHEVTEAADGMEAVSVCREKDFDIIIMDIMMPRMDGFSAAKEIRKSKDIPFILLSARGEEYDKLFGFEVGADDYLVKPFSPRELMARISAIVSRTRGRDAKDTATTLNIGALSIDLPARNVFIDGQKAALTPKEYDLLLFLAKNKNTVLTRDQLLNGVWGYDFFGDDRTVDSHIKMLRSSIGACRDYIITIRGVGYKLEAQ